MAEGDDVAVRRENEQLALAIVFVGGAMHIARRQHVELRLQLRIKRIHVFYVNVMSEAAIARDELVARPGLQQAEAYGFAVHVGIIGAGHPPNREAEQIAEKRNRGLNVRYNEEGSDLCEIVLLGHG